MTIPFRPRLPGPAVARTGLLLLLLLLAGTAWSLPPAPPGLSEGARAAQPLAVHHPLGALDVDALAAEDALNQALGEPPRFAVPHSTRLQPQHAGQWLEIDGYSIWRYRVRAENAASLNFGFSRYQLPAGAALYFYSADGAIVAGPYGDRHNAAHGEFWSPIIAASDVVIELAVPVELQAQVQLELASVNQGYRGFGTALKGYSQDPAPIASQAKTGEACAGDGTDGGGSRSGSCNTDVACLGEDDPWQDQRHSTGAYSRGGAWACSGSLINNTANDRRMLFITATHCGVASPSAAASMVVYWDYEWPTCRRPGAAGGTATNPPDPNKASHGATFLAATQSPWSCTTGSPQCSDVALVEVAPANNPDVQHFWNGWDRSNPAAFPCPGSSDPDSTDGLCASIHHPGVHERRITFSNTNLVTGNISAAQGVHWRINWHLNPPELPNFPPGGALPVSVTEGGSSGSVLYNADRRLIGVLSGGSAACGASNSQQYDLYGKIAHAWEGYGTPTTRIRDYLDPLGTGAMTWDGLGDSAFVMAVEPAALAVCASQGSVDLQVGLEAVEAGFSGPVQLAVSGVPAAASASWSTNPVPVPGSSQLTLGNLAAVASGAYTLVIDATAGDNAQSRSVPLQVSNGIPAAASLQAPANGANGVVQSPTLSWTAVASALEYRVEVATSPVFASPVFDQSVSGTSVTVPPLAGGVTHYWRVTAINGCGQAPVSTVFSFTTQTGPGDCPVGIAPATLLSEDFTATGLGDFTTTGSTGAQTWQRSSTPPAGSPSGGGAALAVNLDSISDQRLISPAVTLPEDASPLTLQFWNHQHMENRSGGCYDGGLLEISTDNGSTWTQVANPSIVHRSYDGSISTGFSNPLGGRNAWCGSPREWENYIIDLDAWAGQTVRFRWRLGTDSSLGRPGWFVDDIKVQACPPALPGADLALALMATPANTYPGADVLLAADIDNLGPGSASGVEVALVLPDALEFIAVAPGSAGDWTCSAAGNQVLCGLAGPLPAAATAPLLELVTLVDPQAALGDIAVEATVSAQTDDPDPANNQDAVWLHIGPSPDTLFRNGFECGTGLAGCDIR